MTMRGFGAHQIGQDLMGRAPPLQPGGDHLVEGACQALEPERAHRLDHLMPLHGGLARYRSARSPRSAGG